MDPIPVIAPVTDRPMTQDEKLFFRQLGGRIAGLRKEQGFTQTQLAEVLGLTQQMVASYEVGRRRVPVSLVPKMATALAVSVEALIGQDRAPPAKRGPAPKLLQQIERIQRLPRAQQRLVLQMLDGVLAQQNR
jgi:transcriptional regulator with XRE-family HTH domain